MAVTLNVDSKDYTINDVEKINNNEYYVDVDGVDGYDKDKDLKLDLTKGELRALLNNANLEAGAHTLEDILNSIDNAGIKGDASEVKAMFDRFKQAYQALQKLKSKLETLQKQYDQASGANKNNYKAQIDKLKPLVEGMETELKDLYNKLAPRQSKLQGTQKNLIKQFADVYKMKDPNANTGPKGTNGGTGSGGLKGASQQGGQKQAANGAPKAAGYTWNYGTGGGYGAGKAGFGFDMNAYLNSIYTDQAVLDGYDSIHENKQKQQKMMMLFFYFAKMAMSGDMSAMYRFMQFILAIISKDKSLQQIHMASKLIELQELNRIATQKLVDFNIDPDDPQSGVDFQKLVEATKAETSSIATSQKLISQMMEEMAQVVETLTGTVKTALDAAGRIGRMLARA